MVAAFGRSQKRAAAFGRRPLLGPYLFQISSTLGLRHICLIFFKQIWTQKRAAAEGRRPLLGAAEGRDHIFASKLAQN